MVGGWGNMRTGKVETPETRKCRSAERARLRLGKVGREKKRGGPQVLPVCWENVGAELQSSGNEEVLLPPLGSSEESRGLVGGTMALRLQVGVSGDLNLKLSCGVKGLHSRDSKEQDA